MVTLHEIEKQKTRETAQETHQKIQTSIHKSINIITPTPLDTRHKEQLLFGDRTVLMPRNMSWLIFG